MSSFIERVLKKILPHKDIVKDDVLYLRRHYLTPRTWRYKLVLHLIAMPDIDRSVHDHPWWFITLVLRGGYLEEVVNKLGRSSYLARRAGSCLFRTATHTHKILALFRPRTWTLVMMGPATRVWGFWDAQNLYTPWHEYLADEDGLSPVQLPEDAIR